ncbi:hypothetical protein [Limnohabitans sp. 2KL-17]|uniref:hypothetical protein n=1 Tax=Limnohabitans sp. 2KL-17 TaxID=1100704 RepID=UPI0013047D63|nr:hypothetical protein [Limnohabitans sp. 2KL-17]
MKMRWLIAPLLVLNVTALAWQFDAFARWSWGPNTAREPERVLNQIRPTAIQVETPAAAAKRLAAETATPDTAPNATPVSASAPVPAASVPAPSAADAPVANKRAASPASNP